MSNAGKSEVPASLTRLGERWWQEVLAYAWGRLSGSSLARLNYAGSRDEALCVIFELSHFRKNWSLRGDCAI
jgi:hypothetical protein